jgi:hypothetical protein
MSAEIIDFPCGGPVRNPGNGAREAVVEIGLELPNDTQRREAEMWADWLLAELWIRGFKVVPVE